MEQIATPALETPLGHIAVLVVGFILANELWKGRETIDLLFFRLTGGNTRAGHFAAIAVPVVVLAAFCWVVVRYL